MRDAVIVEAVRTPVGKRNGGLSGVHPADLSAHVLNALVTRTGIDPGRVDVCVLDGTTPTVDGQSVVLVDRRQAQRLGDAVRRDARLERGCRG